MKSQCRPVDEKGSAPVCRRQGTDIVEGEHHHNAGKVGRFNADYPFGQEPAKITQMIITTIHGIRNDETGNYEKDLHPKEPDPPGNIKEVGFTQKLLISMGKMKITYGHGCQPPEQVKGGQVPQFFSFCTHSPVDFGWI